MAEIYPDAGEIPHGPMPESKSLAGALEHLGLSRLAEQLTLSQVDYMCIDDLLELGRYPREPILAFMLMNMFAAMNDGSVCLLLSPEPFLSKFSSEVKPSAQRLLEQFLTILNKQGYDRLISRHPERFVPLIWIERHVPRLYFQKYFVCEADLKKRLSFFSSPLVSKAVNLSSSTATQIVEELYSPELTIRMGPEGTPMVRDPLQENALKLGLSSPLTIISGGPGTGKTALMVNLLRGFLRCRINVNEILLGAPTGRAAQRMTESIRSQMASIVAPTDADLTLARLKGATIHRILRYDPGRHRFQYHAARLLPVRVIIIDEVSMVDLAMMDHLVRAVDPQNACLIFIGDKHQLPSVEAGAVLADLIPQSDLPNQFKDNLVVLKTVFRSGAELIRLAESINSGILPHITTSDVDTAIETQKNGWDFVPESEKTPLPKVLLTWALRHFFRRTGFKADSYMRLVGRGATFSHTELTQSQIGRSLLQGIFVSAERSRILTLTRVGGFGCEAVNLQMGRILTQAMGQSSRLPAPLFPGCLVIVRRNDYAKELFNGDIGVVLMDADGTAKVYFRKSNLFFGHSIDGLPPFEPAFALTVHQSQGSEYKEILLILPDDLQHRLLTREMLYTAVTRAQRRVVIYGRKDVFEKAVQKRIQRQTGMVD